MVAVPARVRTEVYARDGGACARCGRPCGPLTVQHRRGNGMGGRAGNNGLANLLTLGGSGTTGCHGWTEAHPLEADELGYSVPPGVDPAAWPVAHARWGRVLLLDDGGLHFL